MKSGKLETLAAEYRGKPLAAPNDLVMDAHGHLFFSSRPQKEDTNANAVYRLDPNGKLHQLLSNARAPDADEPTAPTGSEIHMPNGMGISPDGKQFYLIEAHPDVDHHRDIRVYSLNRRGELSQGRVLIDFYPGRSGDGMCVAPDGRLFVAAGLHQRRGTSETLDTKPGIHVLNAQGKLIAFRETPHDTLTNCDIDPHRGWLYATCQGSLLRLKLKG